MIYIYCNDHIAAIEEALSPIEGLMDSVRLSPLADIDESYTHLIIENDTIRPPLPWSNEEPPILFTPLPFDTNDLISLILSKLGYEEEALDFTQNEVLKQEIGCRIQLKNPDQQLELPTNATDYVSLHNRAVRCHYAGHVYNGDDPVLLYNKAIVGSPSDEHKAFTARHLAALLTDHANLAESEALLRKYKSIALSDQAKNHISLDLIGVLMATPLQKQSQTQLEEIKQITRETLIYFEEKDEVWAIASLYLQAAGIASFEQRFAEALEYISKAIEKYENHDYPEFLAAAYMQKGTLLYTWAQDGNSQFYQSAIDTYQQALKTFTRDNHPHAYAEIHHNLAVIYAEMPVERKKRAMWAAFSATSFKECLAFYEKSTYPYEYAMVANNYGNALLKYPPAKTGDNVEKAVVYHLEALEIRTAQQYPVERAHTILNYLEACWRAHNINKTMERARYKDMIAKAKEVKSLTTQPELIAQAQSHIDQLNALTLSILND